MANDAPKIATAATIDKKMRFIFIVLMINVNVVPTSSRFRLCPDSFGQIEFLVSGLMG